MSKLVKHHIFRENTVWKFQNRSAMPSFCGKNSVKSTALLCYLISRNFFQLFHFHFSVKSTFVFRKSSFSRNYDLTYFPPFFQIRQIRNMEKIA